MKKNSKINKLVTIAIIVLILVTSLVIFVLNYTKDSSSLSTIEKNWINRNVNNIIDVSVYNDVPVYGQNGEGIIFSYLEKFTETYGIQFNKISYVHGSEVTLKNMSFKILNFKDSVGSNDIEMYRDYYVIVSKDNSVLNSINDLNEIKLGVLSDDLDNVQYYLNEASNITYVSCETMDEMVNKINSQTKDIEYMAIPKMMYLDEILRNDLNIVYHISELYKKYIISVSGEDNNHLWLQWFAAQSR